MKNDPKSNLNDKFAKEQKSPEDLLKRVSNQNPKIFPLFKKNVKEKPTLISSNWDIKKGDYIPNPDYKLKKRSKGAKNQFDIALLIAFCIIAVLVIILISSWLADKI